MNDKIKELFERYQTGTATPEERLLVNTWFDSNGHDPAVKREIDPAVFEDLDARMEAMLEDPGKVRKLNYTWLQVAAMFLVIAATGFYIRRFYTAKPQPAETFTEIKAIKGVKKEVTLKDGTTVFLNSGSSVFVSSRFGLYNRTVKLTGEAFFQVHHDKTKPFIIRTGKLSTTVLGTSFDINAYPEDENIKVSVSTGKVKVEGTNKSGQRELFANDLIHNQALVYNKTEDSHSIKISNVDSVSSWRSNHLIFDNATNEQIARTLSRWYGIEVELKAAGHNDKKYTLSFNNEKADRVLGILSTLTDMTYTMQGKKVIITPTKHK